MLNYKIIIPGANLGVAGAVIALGEFYQLGEKLAREKGIEATACQ